MLKDIVHVINDEVFRFPFQFKYRHRYFAVQDSKKKKKKRKKVCHGNFEERIATLKLTPTFQSTNSPCIQDLGLKAESKV